MIQALGSLHQPLLVADAQENHPNKVCITSRCSGFDRCCPWYLRTHILKSLRSRTNLLVGVFWEWMDSLLALHSQFLHQRTLLQKQELVNGYETEINYQRHMLENPVVSFTSLSLLAWVLYWSLPFTKFPPPLWIPCDFTSLGWNFLGMIAFDKASPRRINNLQKWSMISIKIDNFKLIF